MLFKIFLAKYFKNMINPVCTASFANNTHRMISPIGIILIKTYRRKHYVNFIRKNEARNDFDWIS